ncbi:phosphatase PAP2 family protein [Xanthocytophaga flava]|uniref:phosphatase PAP2 family protein n=1 Tax=Xanthocytophaga flava TaxID=3048013 RepID=UPI0028D2849B|nr:phosphatase PAP2 family protein [Xanthocytophaga flavus]MDJ1472222.1 phosphatase PAP2 family protein [Xanthocytophaga flavus]
MLYILLNYRISLIEELKAWDTKLFLELNQYHAAWLDPIMYWITDSYFWIPLYLLLVFLIIRTYKVNGVWILVAAILAVGLADYVTSGMIKPYVGRLRPCHVVEIQKNVYVLRGCGGRFGFASSHASTTFALATSLFLFVRSRMSYFIWLFPWAGLVAYSRIYVGVHYPLDILVGACIGVLCGVFLWLIHGQISKRYVLPGTAQ